MNSSIFEQRSRFAMIGALMVIISLMSLVSNKNWTR